MDAQNQTDPNDLLSIRDLARRWRCHHQTAERKVRLLDLPMMQMGRELLARRTDVETLERKILEKKLPRGGTTKGTGHLTAEKKRPWAGTSNGQRRGRPPGRRKVA